MLNVDYSVVELNSAQETVCEVDDDVVVVVVYLQLVYSEQFSFLT